MTAILEHATTTDTGTREAHVMMSAMADAVAALATMARTPRGCPPVMSRARVSVSGGWLTLDATNYDTGAVVTMPSNGPDVAPFLVDRAQLAAALKACRTGLTARQRRDAVVVVRRTETGAALVAPTGASFPIGAPESVDDLPAQPADTATGATWSTTGAHLHTLVSAVVPGASRDDTLPLLTAVRLVAGPTEVTATTTDRYRLHQATTEGAHVDTPDQADAYTLVPARWLEGAAKLVKGAPRVTVATHGTRARVVVTTGSTTVWSLLVDGDYPSVDRLFPTDTTWTLEVDRTALAGIVGQVRGMAQRNIPVTLELGADNVAASVDNGDGTAAQSAPVAADVSADAPPRVAFNPAFLLDALKGSAHPRVTLAGTDPNRPVLFTDASTARVLLVPIRRNY